MFEGWGGNEARQRQRLRPLSLTHNAQLRHRDLRTMCPLTDEAEALLQSALRALHVSARAHDTMLKVARTIADLAAARPSLRHLLQIEDSPGAIRAH